MKQRRGVTVIGLVALMVLALVPTMASAEPGEMMKITGVVDGPLTGGVPKAIEVTAVTDITDLSAFGLGSANNGGGTDGQEFTFPAGTLAAGDVVYVASESTGFTTFFGFAPAYTSGAASINGDDAIELFHEGSVVDVFGEIDVDGSGQAWEYTDGWAKRVAGGPDGSTFVVANWSFSGRDALDGESTNAAATTSYPVEEQATPGAPPPPPPPPLVPIHAVQGSGSSSPIVGERVVVEGIVVGDYETFDHLAGFFVQEEDADADADPSTSEGVFVFNHAGDDVSLGDLVRVEGTVGERFGNTQLTDFVEIEVLSSGNALPTPGSVLLPLASYWEWEAFEGMRVRVDQELVISEYFDFDRYGDVVAGFPMDGESRLYQPTAIDAPYSVEAQARADHNAANQITIDDGLDDENPSTVVHPITRDDVTLDNRFHGGDTVTGLVGPVYYAFGDYRILPDGYDTYEQTSSPASPADVGGRLRAVSFNALNYFLTIDDGSQVCGGNGAQGCRGADSQAEFDRQRAKTLEALIGLDADLIGLNEVENTPGVAPLADLVAGLNDHFGEDTYAYVDTGAIGPDAIKVGIIYRRTALSQVGETAVLVDEILDPLGVGRPLHRPVVAASFIEKGTGEKFSVAVNHFKSKGSGCGSGDDDPWAGSCNASRLAAAGVLADWIETDPTDVKDPDWLILGDLNAYDHEDPVVALEAAGYTDLEGHFGGEFAYSYLFGAALGYLDYAMANEALFGQVTGATTWHINADEPDLFDYDTTFKSATQAALFDPTTPFRSSDHDPVVVGLALDEKPGKGNKGEQPGRGRP